MTRRLIQFFVLSLVLVALLAVTADAKNRPPSEQVRKLQSYGFTKMEKHLDVDPSQNFRSSSPASLGATAGGSPGEGVGFSYYDAQHNSTQGRNVSNRYDGQIHFAWMFGPTSDVASNRTVAYNLYDAISGTWPVGKGVGCAVVDVNAVRAGFVNIDSRPPNSGELGGAAVYAGHSDPSGPAAEGFQVHAWWATTELEFCDWSINLRVDSALAFQYGDPPTWPKLEYLIDGTDTVTLALATSSDDPVGAMVVYRTVGQQGGASWTGVCLDSVFFPVGDLTASRVSNKVDAVYTWPVGNPTNDDGSGDRTIVYRESNDGGVSFGSRIDIAGYTADGPYVAWLEVSCLITSDDNLHVIWNAGPPGLRNCRLWHWADHTGIISTVQSAEWDPFPDCAMGYNSLNIAKFNISECDGNLYAVWAQANDPFNGVTDDCADPNLIGSSLAGNADVFVSVSSTLDGKAWDAARNLTQTYTPGCDTSLGNECDSDNWPTVSRFGMNNADYTSLDFGNAALALTVDPDPGGYSGTHFLDVFYTDDLFPSAGVYTGTPDILTRNDIKWFRLPCVDPVVQSNAVLSPTRVEYPFYLMHGQDSTFDVYVENTGNATLTGTLEAVQTDAGDPSGWLAIDQSSVNLTAIENNVDTVAMTLNVGGVVNSPGTIVNLEGYVVVRCDPPTVRDSVMLTLDFPIADTIVGITWDTISTGCIRLACGNNGNIGQSPTSNNRGGANMDYWGTGLDCDDADSIQYDSLPGNAHVYLYDASPVIIQNSDTSASWAIFGNGLAGENDFKPVFNEDLPDPGKWTGDNYEAYWSGQFVTVDSSITLEKTTFAPTDPDSCNFMVQCVQIYSTGGGAVSGLTVGEAWDWDVPADSGVYNIGGSDPINGVVWLQGAEFDIELDDPDLYECQDNSKRFGGIGFIGFTDQANPTLNDGDPANIYTATNADFVIPNGGFDPAELYENMQSISGTQVAPPTVIEDQHMVMTVNKNYNLAASDTLRYWVVMATVRNGSSSDMTTAVLKGRNWYSENVGSLDLRPPSGCCIGGTGNVNGDVNDVVDISDLTKLVNNLFVTFEPIPCPAEANTNGDANCTVDISDLTKLVNNLFVTFEPLAPCLPACQ